MYVTVWYGDEFSALGCEEFVNQDTRLQDLRKLFPGSFVVTISGDDWLSRDPTLLLQTRA